MVNTGPSNISEYYSQNVWSVTNQTGIRPGYYTQSWWHSWSERDREPSLSGTSCQERDALFTLSLDDFGGWADSPGLTGWEKRNIMVRLLWGAISKAYNVPKNRYNICRSPTDITTGSHIPSSVTIECHNAGKNCGILEAMLDVEPESRRKWDDCDRIGVMNYLDAPMSEFGLDPVGSNVAATCGIYCSM